MGAFDPYPYPILLAEEMNSMFSKKKTNIPTSQLISFGAKTTMLVSAGIFYQCAMDFDTFLTHKKYLITFNMY